MARSSPGRGRIATQSPTAGSPGGRAEPRLVPESAGDLGQRPRRPPCRRDNRRGARRPPARPPHPGPRGLSRASGPPRQPSRSRSMRIRGKGRGIGSSVPARPRVRRTSCGHIRPGRGSRSHRRLSRVKPACCLPDAHAEPPRSSAASGDQDDEPEAEHGDRAGLGDGRRQGGLGQPLRPAGLEPGDQPDRVGDPLREVGAVGINPRRAVAPDLLASMTLDSTSDGFVISRSRLPLEGSYRNGVWRLMAMSRARGRPPVVSTMLKIGSSPLVDDRFVRPHIVGEGRAQAVDGPVRGREGDPDPFEGRLERDAVDILAEGDLIDILGAVPGCELRGGVDLLGPRRAEILRVEREAVIGMGVTRRPLCRISLV